MKWHVETRKGSQLTVNGDDYFAARDRARRLTADQIVAICLVETEAEQSAARERCKRLAASR